MSRRALDTLELWGRPFSRAAGSAALDWLRSHRCHSVPTVTYIPAFHLHPVWAYAGIDQHYVMCAGRAWAAGRDLRTSVRQMEALLSAKEP